MIELAPPSTLISLDAHPHKLPGDLLLGQCLLLAQADKLAAEESTLNNRSLIGGHKEKLLSVATSARRRLQVAR